MQHSSTQEPPNLQAASADVIIRKHPVVHSGACSPVESNTQVTDSGSPGLMVAGATGLKP